MTSDFWTEKEKEINNMQIGGMFREASLLLLEECRKQHEKEMFVINNYCETLLKQLDKSIKIDEVEKAINEILTTMDWKERLKQSIRNLTPHNNVIGEQGSSSAEATGTTLTSSKRNPVLCSCGHDKSCHPRRPCIVGWDGIDNFRACQCTEFTPKQAEEQQE